MGCKVEKIIKIIRKLRVFVQKLATLVRNETFIPKWEVDDNQKCHVKFSILLKQSFAIQSVIPDKVVVHNNNSYISEDIVLKNSSAKFV